jgi:predicted Zn-dependent protease
MKTISLPTQALLLLCLTSPSWAATAVDSAVTAENQQRWDDASRLYREALKQHPDDVAAWTRLSNVEARRGNAVGAAEALEKASVLTPSDSARALAASQAWAQANKPQEALAACRRANALSPGQEDILRTCAVQANWSGDSAQSALFWDELLKVYAGRADDRRQYAQTLGWAGRLDDAVPVYQAYLAESPQDAATWLNYVQVESWRGDYAAAEKALATYRERFGETAEYHATRGRMLAWANWPDAAQAEIAPLLAAHPDDYELNYTQTVIARNAQRQDEALDYLERAQVLRPQSKDTFDLARVTRLPNRPAVTLQGYAYEDSDSIRIQRLGLSGLASLNPRANLLAGIATEWNRADADSGYTTLDGDQSTLMSSVWLGGNYRFSQELGMEVRLGGLKMDDYGDKFIGSLRADVRPDDKLSLVFMASRAPFTPSPLAVSNVIMADQVMVQAYWRPTLESFVDAYLAYANLSDDNNRTEFGIAPRWAVMRTQSINLDVGLSGRWMDYDQQLNNGYWSPNSYQRYALTLLGQWKINDDDNVVIRLSPGEYKDASMGGFKFGTDATLEGTFGLYRDFYAHAALNYSSNSLLTGNYDAWSIMFDLSYRF